MHQNVGIVRGIWKENDIRNGDEGSQGYGILVEKERECRIRTPRLQILSTVIENVVVASQS